MQQSSLKPARWIPLTLLSIKVKELLTLTFGFRVRDLCCPGTSKKQTHQTGIGALPCSGKIHPSYTEAAGVFSTSGMITWILYIYKSSKTEIKKYNTLMISGFEVFSKVLFDLCFKPALPPHFLYALLSVMHSSLLEPLLRTLIRLAGRTDHTHIQSIYHEIQISRRVDTNRNISPKFV